MYLTPKTCAGSHVPRKLIGGAEEPAASITDNDSEDYHSQAERIPHYAVCVLIERYNFKAL